MPQRKKFLNVVGKLLLFTFLGWAVAIVRAARRRDGWDDWSAADDWTPPALADEEPANDPQPLVAQKPRGRRLAYSFTFATLFFAGASFTAGAGDMVAKALEPAECAALMATTGEGEEVCVSDQAPDAVDAEPTLDAAVEPAVEPAESVAAAAQDPVAPAEPESESASVDAEASASPEQDVAAAAGPEPSAPSAAGSSSDAPASEGYSHDHDPAVLEVEQPAVPSSGPRTRHWVVRRARETKAHAPVIEHEGGEPTVWLNRALPDPTPPAKRLSPEFAKKLRRIAAANGLNWALVLAVLRVEGATERVPATTRELHELAKGLRVRGAADNEWAAVLALSGRTSFADRVIAVARYNRAVGLNALVRGLEKAKPRLIQQLLTDNRIDVYGGGRDDIAHNRIDVRVVVLIQYLAESYGQVTVSSLFTGHRKYARPGVVSAHIYGQAVDISGLGGQPVFGHQEPGSITEKAVRSILLLPVELQPRQVISLLGLGGPSFPLANHDDHIHVGY